MEKLKCPHCGSEETVRIVYGLPASGTEYDKRDYVLGGCVIRRNSPTHECRDCDKGFMTGVAGSAPKNPHIDNPGSGMI